MAADDGAFIKDSWENLRANPVFRRTLMPRGLRGLVRSPIARSVVLTIAALAVYELAIKHTLAWWPVLIYGVLFWFLIEAMQRYFAWLELTALASSGTLDDYLNSGLSRADVALGVIFPAIIAETLAVSGVMGWFVMQLGAAWKYYAMLLLVAIFLSISRLFRPPSVFLPDLDAYMRKRNPLTLFLLSIAVLVPLIIWFAIYYSLFWLILFASAFLPAGSAPSGQTVVIVAAVATWFIAAFPSRWWAVWRLKRFYKRYRSFDDLFERYIEHRTV